MANTGATKRAVCIVCQKFDVRDLLLASATVPVSDDETVWERLRLKSIRDEPTLLFKQHPNLVSLKQASDSCDLCASIWQWYSNNSIRSKVADEALSSGVSLEQIYITCTPANNLWQKFPQVVAFQKGQDDSTRILASFDPYAVREHVPTDGGNVLLRSIYPFSGSRDCLRLASRWLETCLSHHQSCDLSQGVLPVLPTRVIDVGLRRNGKFAHPRLAEGKGRRERYVALSYCWGGESALVLNQETKNGLRAGVALEDYPATLRDAITVVRSLAVPYIWIDALCIIQGDAADWATEAAKMRNVYRYATLTISASAASKTSEGMFCDRRPPTTVCQLPWHNGADLQEFAYLRPAVEVMDAELRGSFINTRGWCLQESLLSPRTLWFGRKQIMFECCEGQVNEAGHNTQATEYYRNKGMINQMDYSPTRVQISRIVRSMGIPAVINVPYHTVRRPLPWDRKNKANKKVLMRWHHPVYTQGRLESQSGRFFTLYHQWREIVRRYTERSLTKQEDTFPALSGLAEHFAKAIGDHYVAGMWRGDLVRCLNWARLRPHREHSNGHPANTARPTGYIAPSWSWASVCGAATDFPPMENATESGYLIQNIAKVIDVSVELASADPYGRLKGGYLTLRAPFLSILSPLVKHHSDAQYPASQEYLHQEITLDLNRMAHNFHQQHEDCQGQLFGLVQTCITTEANVDNPVCSLHMLLVESTGSDTFRRLGHDTVQLSGRLVGSLEDPYRDMKREIRDATWVRKTITMV